MAAVDLDTVSVARQFDDAVEDQLQDTLEGRARIKVGAEDTAGNLHEDERENSFSDDGSSEEEEDDIAWDWEGRTSDLTKKYNAARLVGPYLFASVVGRLQIPVLLSSIS